jgi:ATP-dependent Lhr-like helicase
LDAIHIPPKPMDILAQQIVAAAACEDWEENKLFELMRRAYPYRELQRGEFNETVRMLSEGFSTKRGRRGALIHHDAVNHRIRGRRGARLVALTSGGAIPDNADYRVVVEPGETFVGTVNEDFAIESMAGDIFQLGNTSWKILQVISGVVRVEDAKGQPPGMPFWLGEGPARTAELSSAVSKLRDEVQEVIERNERSVDALMAWFVNETNVPEAGARQLAEYFCASYKSLGVIPSQTKLVMERFFDESGGMQLVIHAPFGARLNRAWGLALRKRFCRSFNFELQAAATDDAIVLSLGTQHSFSLAEVFHYLNSKSVREVLVQALLDAPMFPIRWRWNASRALALPRHRNGRKIAAPLQRMESENLLAAVFPDQLACLENIAGDREVPDHPLVKQTIEDCLTEAMDIEGLESLLREIEQNKVTCVARDLPEPSPLAHEILNARPYAFLDDAPLEERRTQAVYTRRASGSSTAESLGRLDAAAIERVSQEAWPDARNSDELHEALLLLGVMTKEEITRTIGDGGIFLDSLIKEHRAGQLNSGLNFWVAAERLPMVQAVYPATTVEPEITPPETELKRTWDRQDAIRELMRGRMEVSGPITASTLEQFFHLSPTEIEAGLLALEAEGFILRGRFRTDVPEIEWCDRRLLARIHRQTLDRLRAEIKPVSLEHFQRFLLAWQQVDNEHRAEGPTGLEAVLEKLDGLELAASAWEPEVLALRVKDYSPQWLDQLCLTGRLGWGRLSRPQNPKASAPLRSTRIAVFARENLAHWLELSPLPAPTDLPPDTDLVLKTLAKSGAMFFSELVRETKLLPTRVSQALGELVAQGWATADSFEGLRALLLPSEKRIPFSTGAHKRRHRTITSVEFAGRWTLLRKFDSTVIAENSHRISEKAVEAYARVLLHRYGVVFRRLMERESLGVSWFELGRMYRRLEARGEIRGGHFVNGVSGEQFALPEAVGMLRSMRRAAPAGELVVINAADPLNLLGIPSPGPRLTAITANRVLLRDGRPIAALEAGEIKALNGDPGLSEAEIEHALKIGKMTPTLRTYYAH